MSGARRGVLYAGLLYLVLVWGSTFTVVKGALEGIHPLALIGWRFSIAAACLLPFALRSGELGRTLRPGAVLALLLLGLYIPHTEGLRHTSAANSGFLTGAFILFVPAFMFLRDGRFPRLPQCAAAALAMAGVAMVTGGVSGLNAGDALTLGSTLMYAAHLFATDRSVRAGMSVVALAFHQLWMAGAFCLAASLAAGIPLATKDAATAKAVLFLALLPTLSAFLVQMKVQKSLPPMTVSLVFSLEPLVAALFAWKLGGEALGPRAVLGGVLIVAAIVLGEAGPAAGGPIPAVVEEPVYAK